MIFEVYDMNDLPAELDAYLAANDFSAHTKRAICCDMKKFVRWFNAANAEAFDPARVTTSDVSGFRDHLRNVRRQGVSTVNRALVTIRRFLGYMTTTGTIKTNPARAVKELRRMPAPPRGLSTSEVRKVMREVELRGDRRAAAIIGVMLHAGLRVSDVVGLEIGDLTINPRSGYVVCRNGKGGKQRVVPLSIEGRRVLSEYLEVRPPVQSAGVFIGERGALTTDGVRAICEKFSAISGVRFTPHTLRHSFAHRYLEATNNDLVGLAQILGHENLNTTSIYTKRSQDDLQQRIEDLRYG